MRHNIAYQQGSMLAVAIFVIVVMTMLSLSIINVVTTAADGVVHEVYGLRAQHAARSGLERRLASVFQADGSVDTSGCGTLVSQVFDANSAAGLAGCRYDTQCQANTYSTNAGSALFVEFESTGSCQAGDFVVSRTLEVDAIER